MSEELRLVVKLSINDGQLDDFKRIGSEMIDTVAVKDTGTLAYEWYLSEDGRNCTLLEAFQDFDALLEHLGNVGDVLQATLQYAELTSVDVFANLTPALMELAGQFNATVIPRGRLLQSSLIDRLMATKHNLNPACRTESWHRWRVPESDIPVRTAGADYPASTRLRN